MRDYDPTTGRYIQADPLGLVDGASVYGYALQSPQVFIDPRGENKILYEMSKEFAKRLKRSKKQKKTLPKKRGDREIEKPEKIKGHWHCKCRADFSERNENVCNAKAFSFGSAAHKNRSAARKLAEAQALINLGAELVHHVGCTCTGPQGQVWRRGG